MYEINLKNLIKRLEFILENWNDPQIVEMGITLIIADIKEGME